MAGEISELNGNTLKMLFIVDKLVSFYS